MHLANVSCAQNIIDIRIDTIYGSADNCGFYNFSNESIYKCDLEAFEQAEYRYDYVFECFEKRGKNIKLDLPNKIKLKKISNSEKFLKWASEMSFEISYSGDTLKSYYSSVNENYGYRFSSHTRYGKKEKTRTCYRILPIRVNNEYYIGGLQEMQSSDIETFIIPSENGSGVLMYRSKIYNSCPYIALGSDETGKEVFFDMEVRVQGDKKILTTSHSLEQWIDAEYDEIAFYYPYVLTRNDDRYEIFDNNLDFKDVGDIKTAYLHKGAIQIIADGKLQWLHKDGILHDTMPRFNYNYCASSYPIRESHIVDNDSVILELVDFGKSSQITIDGMVYDTFPFIIDEPLEDVRRPFNMCDIKLPIYRSIGSGMYFYFKKKNGKEGMLKRVDLKRAEEQKVWKIPNLSHEEKMKLYRMAQDTIPYAYRDEIIFEGRYEEFKFDSFCQPIILKQKGFYSLFPNLNNSKYKFISDFDGFLAKVVFENGKSGWVDIFGKEFLAD